MKKIILSTSAMLLVASPSIVAVSCNETETPTIQAWGALSDNILTVTMEDAFAPYNFKISTEVRALILEQADSDTDITADDGMTPSDAKDWAKFIVPVDPSSEIYDVNNPYIAGIDPYMAKLMAKNMSTETKTITPKIFVQDWEAIKAGWTNSSPFDMVISAMAPDPDKLEKHKFTNEYLLTEYVIAKWYDTPRLDAKTILNWKNMSTAEKTKYGKIAVVDFPTSDPTGLNNVAVKYFGKEWVKEAGEMSDVYSKVSTGEFKYAFIEDIQGEEFELRSMGAFGYATNLFPLEEKIKSAMSVKPGTPDYVVNHINSYLAKDANLVEQDWLKLTSLKLHAYVNKE